jgi:hypothetical protein
MKLRYILFFIITLIPFVNYAQSSYELGVLPSVNFNKKLPKDYSVNFKTESRQSLFKEEFSYDYLLTDISLGVSKRVGINTTVSIGYLLRIEDDGIKPRTIQQASYINRFSYFNLAHRLSADQTFDNQETEFRFRYRLSAEIPLNGQSLDPREFFLKFSNEYLNAFQGSIYDLEVRGAGFIGFAISPSSKLELGVDYRIDSFLNNNPRNRFWTAINFYQSL